MSPVETREVAFDEADLRLDRWFKRHFPGLAHGQLQKLLRTGQIRVEGRRAKANQRLAPGQQIRVPPLAAPVEPTPKPTPRLDPEDAAALRAAVLYRDDAVIALNKPPGLAVQGGSRVAVHLDAMLDALRFGAPDRPRLVHRLDKDTSGVLLLGRTPAAAARLATAFRRKATRKLYWALVVGVPKPRSGTVDLALAKGPAHGGERMMAGVKDGKRAVTRYHVLEAAGREVAWLALSPITGRTHQLRAHCAALGTPILGDGKYGGKGAFLQGHGVSRKMHLHAREIALARPDGSLLTVAAPLPEHMARSFQFFGFDPAAAEDPFAPAD
ncbi:MAG: RluA family pseudouridine synthase [Alphaproteobacteria bacterium]|nr:RluA family pseudouridine synthase [Alphaproteobacteria bacterium]